MGGMVEHAMDNGKLRGLKWHSEITTTEMASQRRARRAAQQDEHLPDAMCGDEKRGRCLRRTAMAVMRERYVLVVVVEDKMTITPSRHPSP